jgi:Holliday junction resolvasome RuvABC endonuclease subunit
MNPIIKIAGIDPSLRNTGLSLASYNIETGDWSVSKIGIVQTENQSGKQVRKSSDDYRSARELIIGVNKFVVEHGVSFVCAEVPTGAQSARAAFSNGVCCGVLAAVPVPLIQVSPTEVKMASVGNRTASKAQMIAWAMGKWPEAGWLTRKLKGAIVPLNDNEHPADACAAIAAGIETVQFAQALAMMASMRAVSKV